MAKYVKTEEGYKKLIDIDEHIQSDWNQNDHTAPDYVKNRPFYTDDPVETVLFDGTVMNDGGFGVSLIVGQKYIVILDGVEYVLTAWEDTAWNCAVLGSESLWNGIDYVDTEPPFCINGDQGGWFYTVNDGDEHTLKVISNVSYVHKIDKKYLPDTVLYKLNDYSCAVTNFGYAINVIFDTNIYMEDSGSAEIEYSDDVWETLRKVAFSDASIYKGRWIGFADSTYNLFDDNGVGIGFECQIIGLNRVGSGFSGEEKTFEISCDFDSNKITLTWSTFSKVLVNA